MEGKIKRKLFHPVGEIHSTRSLERVHSDVCGPLPESIGHGKYFVTFIDDYSRTCAVYFMRHKSEVFQRFKEYEALVTNDVGGMIGVLCSDNGGEYVSGEFENYLRSKGIHHELTVPNCPQQNGITEHMNRTLMECARCHAGVPKSYWAETISVAAYLKNRTVTTAVGSTPYERWYGRKPNLSNLCVFGCMAESQLDKKTEKLRFVGYSVQLKGYRLLDEKNHRVAIRQNAIFSRTFFVM